jgi:hypothetical protein
MKMIKNFILIFVFLLCSFVSAQIHSVKLYGEYSKPTGKRLLVTDIDALGGGVNIRIDLVNSFFLNANIAYNLYTLDQESAIAQWDWRYWDRYEEFIELTLQDNAYTAEIIPIQKMDVIPISLTFCYEFKLSNSVDILPYGGGGVFFYTRRLSISEDWIKHFESIDYDFAYSFRNIAPQKQGNPLFITGGLEIVYRFAEFFSLNAAANYISVLQTNGKLGFENFPFDKAININFGIGFIY